ncbi:MAG: hypothetical protein HUJ71_08065 [Pseudobutyrivibrio sp.]|nr:hypothetical protein [Pseudobutyrivibrio sp.]
MEKCKSKVFARKIFVFILMACTIIQTKNIASANNYKDATFDFNFYADGSDGSISPAREKQDDTATYVKNNAKSTKFNTAVAGTNVATSCTGIDPKIYSDWVSVPTGSYRYISNWLYGNRKYAYPMVVIRQDNAIHKVSGKWSPDNISNRY